MNRLSSNISQKGTGAKQVHSHFKAFDCEIRRFTSVKGTKGYRNSKAKSVYGFPLCRKASRKSATGFSLCKKASHNSATDFSLRRKASRKFATGFSLCGKASHKTATAFMVRRKASHKTMIYFSAGQLHFPGPLRVLSKVKTHCRDPGIQKSRKAADGSVPVGRKAYVSICRKSKANQIVLLIPALVPNSYSLNQ